MGFRYHKRIDLGDGVGINVSKSGVSSSVRTKYGTIGTKGFSIRTGIPGLTWRSGFGKKNTFPVMLVILLVLGGVIVAYNLIRFAIFVIGWVWNSIFTEQGVNYKFLAGFLAVVSGLVVLMYYYTPETDSTPFPTAPAIESTPFAAADTASAEPIPEKPKRKKRDKIKQDIPAVSSEAQVKEYPEETENKEPEAPPTPITNIESESIKEPSDTSESISGSKDLPTSEPKPEELNGEGKKTKWYQFRKRRAEKKQEQEDSQPDKSDPQGSD